MSKENESLPAESRPELTSEEVKEVNDYLSEETPYYDVNEHLRSGGRLGGGSATLQAAIDKAGVFAEPVLAYRGIQVEDVDDLMGKLDSGEFTDRGFFSASTWRAGSFDGNVQFKVHVKKGLDASFYGSNRGEILLPANSDFKVLAVKKTGSRVEAELEQIIYA